MSECYSICRSCEGTGSVTSLDGETGDCFICGGTGISGDATQYMQKQADEEKERNVLER
jgi:hypothetical protein